METNYTSYTKVIENKTYYFVKKFISFPEFKDVPPFLESYGMHTDFEKACSIASINDPQTRQKLLNEVVMENTAQQAKVIDLNNANFSGKSIAL